MLVSLPAVAAFHAPHPRSAKIRLAAGLRLATTPERPSTCAICKSQFLPSENHDNRCSYHPGRWLGAENAKHFGTHTGPGGVEPGLTLFWDCCSATSYDAPGCCRGRCLTYDEIGSKLYGTT